MKYYSEGEMKELRLALEDYVLSWPQVGTSKMFGCPCYRARGTLFAFLFLDSLVVTGLGEKDRERISRQRTTMPFEAANRKIKRWVRIPVQDKQGIDDVMSFVRKSYRAALEKAKD